MKNKVQPPAIVIGSGVVTLGVMDDLASDGISVVHISTKPGDLALRSRWSNEKIVLQPSEDQSRELLSILMDPARNWNNACLIPTIDPMVRIVSRLLPELAPRFVTPVQSWDKLLPVIDKDRLYKIAKGAGVPTPSILYEDNFHNAAAWASEVGYPVIVKPTQTPEFFARFGVKALEAKNETELLRYLSTVKNSRLEVMVSEIIPGEPDNLRSYRCYISRNGRIIAEICTQKIRSHPPDYGVGIVQKTIAIDDKLQSLGIQLLRSLDFRGFANVEFKYDIRNDTYKLIEINPRPVLAQRIFRKAGINFAALTYRDLLELPTERDYSYKNDVVAIQNIADLYYLKTYARKGFGGIWEFIKPYLARRKAFMLPPLRDPGPWWYELKKIIFGKIRRSRKPPANIPTPERR